MSATTLADWLATGELLRRHWRFQTEDGGYVHVPYMRLLDGGRIAGDSTPNARRWRVRDGALTLLDEVGRAATRVEAVSLDAAGRARLTARFLDGTRHVLQEIDAAPPLAEASALTFIGPGPSGTRPNLVVLRANEHSIHGAWTDDLPDEDRSWDLCISWYGKSENFREDGRAEMSVLQNQDRKFGALHKLLHRDSPLWTYERFVFPDDDLQMDRSAINAMLEVCSTYALQLAQPSLHPSSYINYFETRQQPEFILRFVNFVELMMPIFSRDALRACIGTFALNESGFGIDFVWSRLIEGPMTALAIIDKVAVRHTRLTGASYDLEAARLEGHQLANRYGKSDYQVQRELGGVRARGDRRNRDYVLDPDFG